MRVALIPRFSFIVFFSAACGAGLRGQDMTQMQTQMAQQAQMQQQQMQQTQQTNQQQQQAAQAANEQGSLPLAKTPKFSVKAGQYPGAITVKIEARSRGSVIYYTTDGWTPTQASNLYHGPIQITQSTSLQAIAVSPYYARSAVMSAVYTLPASASAGPESKPLSSDAALSVLPQGTAVPLIFAATVTSKDVKVGDRLPVVLAEDLRAGGVVVAAKGTPAVVRVFQVDKSGIQGFPGVIQFEVESVDLADGTRLPLKGSEKMEGASNYKKAGWLDVVPAGGAFVRGSEAVIERGARLTAFVAGTPVQGNLAQTGKN